MHSDQSASIRRLDFDLREIPEGDLDDSFMFRSRGYLQKHGIVEILLGLVWSLSERTDLFYGRPLLQFGPSRLNLAAIDLFRGREHEVACYNAVRRGFGLAPRRAFAEITDDAALQKKLAFFFGNVAQLDALVGALAERPFAAGFELGELLSAMFAEQFGRVRAGDRFWYEREFCVSEVRLIKEVSLAVLLQRNFGAFNVHPYVFLR